MEDTQKQRPLPSRLRRWLVRRHVLYQNSNVTNATAKFLWERVEHLLDYLDEMFMLHPSPKENKHGSAQSRITIVFVFINMIFFAVAVAVALVFLFVFLLVWLLSREDFGSYRSIRWV